MFLVLFLTIGLKHAEGELAAGLGRRTFDAQYDDDSAEKYDIAWFERKNKRVDEWGKQPGFRLTVANYDSRRRPIPQTSVESFSDFIPIAVQTTPATAGSNEPSLSQDCLAALRAYLQAGEEGGEEEMEGEEEEPIGRSSKKARKAVVSSDED